MGKIEKIKDIFDKHGYCLDIRTLSHVKEELDELTSADLNKISRIIEVNEAENPEESFSFSYYTEFKPAERPRSVPVFDKNTKQFKGIRVYDPTTNKESKIDLRESMIYHVKQNKLMELDDDGRIKLIKGNFSISIKMYKKTPNSFSKAEVILAEAGYITPDTKPDTDNIGKNILDAFTRYIYSDDKSNDYLEVEKFYSVLPRIEITIRYRMKKIKTKKI